MNIILLLFIILFIILFLDFVFVNEKFESLTEKKINIVYFIYINKDRDWDYIVKSQLNDIKKSNILSVANLFIVVCDENNIVNKLYFDNILENINYNIDFHNKNHFEYYGIKKLYDLAQNDPDKLYVYLHSKGMVFHNTESKRNKVEEYLTNNLLNNYKKIINIFEENENITKVASFPSTKGFAWFNFFYVRGSYLKKCKEPIISNDRFYYESYLGDEYINDDKGESYSLYLNKNHYFTHTEAASKYFEIIDQ
jgi:hypothetical protein